MSIVSSEVTSISQQSTLTIKVKELHIDQLGVEYPIQYIADTDYDTAAALSLHASQTNQSTIDTEILNAINTYEAGGDPLHYDGGGYWVKITPDYQTWDELAASVTINFLSRENQLDLVYIETTITRISTNDKKDLWGMTNQEVSSVNADIQDAINTKEVLDTYTPFFIDGVKV